MNNFLNKIFGYKKKLGLRERSFLEIINTTKINNVFDLLWKLPKSYTDRSLSSKIENLRIGEIQTVTIIPKKYFFFMLYSNLTHICY